MRMNNNHDTLNLLMEECAEVIQACSKIIRFGPDNFHPDTKVPNQEQLEKELGDVMCLINLLNLDYEELELHSRVKRRKLCEITPRTREHRHDQPTANRLSTNR